MGTQLENEALRERAELQRGRLEAAKARARRFTTTLAALAVLLLLVVFAFNL